MHCVEARKQVGALAICTAAWFGTLVPGSAMAASGNIYFGGDITYNNACVIIVGNPGTLASSVNGDQLSSKLSGGQQGTADIYSIWRYDISVSAPGFFSTAPQGGNDSVNFTASFSGQSLYRGRTFAERPGNDPVRLRTGFSVTRVFVDLVADRPNVFPAGNYATQATVRCE